MFIAYVKQSGDGCDYTIGCGQTQWELEAATRTEAIEELKLRVLGVWSPDPGYEEGRDEGYLKTVVLFDTISKEEMPLASWYSEARDRKTILETMKIEAAERAELERLEAKFERVPASPQERQASDVCIGDIISVETGQPSNAHFLVARIIGRGSIEFRDAEAVDCGE